MDEPRWTRPLTPEEMRNKLGMAACGLHKLAEWTEADTRQFGSNKTFAKTVLELVYQDSPQPPAEREP